MTNEQVRHCEALLGENLVALHDALDLQIRQKDARALKALAAIDEAWRILAKATKVQS
jgi:hypothetical protein